MLSVTARRLVSLLLSCLVSALVLSSGFDALWEIIGAETNVSRHLSVLSSEHEHAATEYLRIYATHQVMRRKASPTHPSLIKECQHRAWFYDLQLFSGGEHSHR